jgi:hypothetical protein
MSSFRPKIREEEKNARISFCRNAGRRGKALLEEHHGTICPLLVF